MRVFAACVIASLGWHGVNAAPPGTPGEGLWQVEPPMHYARAAHAVVGDGEHLYALAGTGAGGAPVLVFERFDGTAWRDEGTIPGPGLNAPAAAELHGKIYLIGGFQTDTNVPSATVRVYDRAAGTWSQAASLPTPRGGHAAVVLEGRIHVLGGGNSTSTIADHTVYDPKTNAWSPLAPLPRAEGSVAAVAFGGKLYAIGGRSGYSDFGTVYVYDPATDRWSDGPPIAPRGTSGAVAHCGAIYVFGGESQQTRRSLGEVFRLRPGGAWERVSSLPTPRNFARAVILGDAVYVVGGSPTPEASHASVGSRIVERFRIPCAPGTIN